MGISDSINCENVQSAIASDFRREPANEQVRAHLTSCRDCHRYSFENRALLALLGAQPAIAAPPDFDFKLRARLEKQRDHQHNQIIHNQIINAAEESALLALLGAQPSIEAPADFDFKLRARLARAKSEAAPAGGGIFGQFREKFRPFTLSQAVAATTTLAVVVAVSALHLGGNGRPQDQSLLGRIPEANKSGLEQVAAAAGNSRVSAVTEAVSSRSRNRSFASASALVRTRALSAEVRQANYQEDNQVNNQGDNDDGLPDGLTNNGRDDMWRGFDAEKRQMITIRNRDLIGAENSASAPSKAAAFVPSI